MEISREAHQKRIEKQIQKQISQWDTRLGVLKTRIERAGNKARVELKQQLAELNDLQISAKRHFEEFLATSAEKWKVTKASLEETWAQLSGSMETTWARVK